jgi:hypothetical protein
MRQPILSLWLPAAGREPVSPLSRVLLRTAALHPGQPASVLVVYPDQTEIDTCHGQSMSAVEVKWQ